jgi:FHA domain
MGRALSLDVSDGGLLGLAEDGAVLGPSPGFALVESGEAVFGEEALRRSRLSPRLVASDYWSRLDAEPLGPPFPDGLSSADLVHGHLESLWGKAKSGTGEVVLAVPGVYDEGQLGLLLGIVQALAMPVTGLVDAAVAAASAGFPGERLIHVDVGLRRAVVTEVRQASSLVRERVARLGRWGQDEIHDAEMRGAAAAFVRQARYDPLHDAPSEQALFDRLPAWLAALEHDERATWRLPFAAGEATIEVTRSEAEAWTARFAEELSQQVSVLKRAGEGTTVLVSAHAARLPGLAGRLATVRGVDVVLLPVQAAAAGALRGRDVVRSPDGAVRFVTQLPHPPAPEGTVGGAAVILPPVAKPLAPRHHGRRPTHVLLGPVARAITEEPLVVGTAPPSAGRSLRLEGETAGISRAHCRLFESAGAAVVEDLSTWGTYVNGERVSGRAVLSVGDRVRVGSPGVELLLIAAED